MSTIATISLRNHTRDLSVKYALYEYIYYFKDDPEMLDIVTGGEESILQFFNPTMENFEYATPFAVKLNNILADLGDAAEEIIPKNKKNHYKKNPFVKVPLFEPKDSTEGSTSSSSNTTEGSTSSTSAEEPRSQIFKLHPSLTFYSTLCTALDVENSEKDKKDRGSLGLCVSSAWDGKDIIGNKFNSLNHFIRTPLLKDYNNILTEYGFAIDTLGSIYDENGRVKEPYICGADLANCEINLNNEVFSLISPDSYFEEQTALLQRKLIILPTLRLLDQHKRGDIVHAVDQNTLSKGSPRFEIAKETFLKTFLSLEVPKFDSTEGVLEMICYIEDQLKK